MDKDETKPIDQVYISHEWVAMSLGEFMQFIVDSGEKDSVIFRILKDEKVDDTSAFSRRLDVWIVPSGHVAEKMLEIGCNLTNRVFRAQFKSGIVK